MTGDKMKAMKTLDSGIQAVADATGPLFDRYPEIDAVWLFGSRADSTANDASDYDFAFLCAPGTPAPACRQLQMELGGRLTLALHHDRVDVVCLNTSLSSELKFAVVEDGVVIFDRGRDLDDYAMRLRHEYWDHMATLRRLGLTRT